MRGILAVFWAVGCAGEDVDHDGVPAERDCNDTDPSQTAPRLLYVDADGDGYAGDTQEVGCAGSSWLFEEATDCSDDDPAVHPGIVEIGCDGRDNDCDVLTADGPAFTVGATWPTVQAAIDAAGHNEEVQLCASTVHEDVWITTPVTLRGQGAGLTILEGTGVGPVVVVGSGLAGLTTLSDFSIRGGSGLDVAGVRVGGGVHVSGSLAVLQNVEVFDNQADDGAGLAVVGEASVTLIESSIHDNTATNRGGGLYTDGATSVSVKSTDLTGNVALIGGGWWVSGIVTLEQSTISGNHASWGGGVALDEEPPFETKNGFVADDGANTQIVGLAGAVISANSAFFGGGVYGTGNLVGVVVDANDADEGGGVYATGPLVLFESTVSGNHALTGSGGGISLPPDGSFVGSDLHILANTAAGAGGGLFSNGATFVLLESNLETNVAQDGGGLAVVGVCPGCTLEGTNVDFAYNVALGLGGDIVMAHPDATLHLTGTQLLGGTAPRGASVAVVAGTVDLDDAHVIDAVATDPANAAIEVAEVAAAFGVSMSEFAGNDPTDVRVLPFEAQLAPGESFVCASGALCTTTP
jgi:hypothetical protein